jgi:hypothetical protein
MSSDSNTRRNSIFSVPLVVTISNFRTKFNEWGMLNEREHRENITKKNQVLQNFAGIFQLLDMLKYSPVLITLVDNLTTRVTQMYKNLNDNLRTYTIEDIDNIGNELMNHFILESDRRVESVQREVGILLTAIKYNLLFLKETMQSPMSTTNKYLKYKTKYLQLKKQL